MGTRSVIAVPLDNGWQGRYAHWDGYPSSMAVQLHAIIKRLGIDAARKVLTEDHYSWSTIGADTPAGDSAVEGVGVYHTDTAPSEWITWDGHAAGTEWCYILNDTHLSVLERHSDGWKQGGWVHRGDLPYDQELTVLQVTALECGVRYERCTHYAWAHFPELGTADMRGTQEYLASLPPTHQ